MHFREWGVSGCDDCHNHDHDMSYHVPHDAECVVYPLSTEEVSAVMTISHDNRIAVTCAGARTGLEGGAIPVYGGVVIDMTKMDNILEFYEADMQVDVQAGVMKSKLQAWCTERNLFFGVDPGSDATLGGYASTGASGTLSCKYGTMRENVIRMRVVLPDGRVMWTRQRAIKSSTGYDLNRMFMGSEGTLGIVTELTVRLHTVAPHVVAAVAAFPTLRQCAQAVIAIERLGSATVARCELLNAECILDVNKLFGTSHAVQPTLFLEFHDTAVSGEAAEVDAKRVEATCVEHGCTSYARAHDEKERDQLWAARRGAYFAAAKSRDPPPGRKLKLCVTDVCVPISRYADVISATEDDFAATRHKLGCPVVGHALDGNFHVMCPFDPADPEMVQELRDVEHRMVTRAIEAGGTASGEHGVGLGKRQYQVQEHGEVFVDVMARIKNALDPQGIMNPGKVLPEETPLNNWNVELVSACWDVGVSGCV